jgi:predicted O-methyltransferase YrrM
MKTIIPRVPDNFIIKEAFPIRILQPQPVDGNISLFELVVLNKLVKYYKIRNAFEIGTFNGRTSLNIAANLPASGKVFTLDLPKSSNLKTKFPINKKDSSGWSDYTYIKKKVTGLHFLRHAEGKKITQLTGDSGTFDFTPYYGKMDFVFVDGSHSSAYVKNDTEIALQLVSKKGVILWHDYGVWHGVTSTLNDIYRHTPKFKGMKHIARTTMVICKL